MSTPARILAIIRPHAALALGALGCTGLIAGTTVGYAWLAGPILESFRRAGGAEAAPDGSRGGTVAALAATVLAIALVRAVAGYGHRILTAKLGQRVVRALREEMYAHLLRASGGALLSTRPGELAARLGSDAMQVQALVATNLAATVTDVVTLGALALFALRLDPFLAAVALAAVPPIALVAGALASRLRRAHRRVWERYQELSSHAAELSGAAPVIRAYGAEAHAMGRFEARSRALEEAALAASRWGALAGPAVQLLGASALALALLCAAPRLQDGSLSPGTFVSFFVAVFFVYRPVQGLAQTVQRVAAGLSALDRTREVLDLPTEPEPPPGAEEAPPLREALTARGVHFAYRPGEPVLRGVDLRVEPGESVAIVGGSGEGKTTLLRLLLGLLRADAGEIAIDGRPVGSVRPASWRERFAWVTQEPLIFADTVLANVALSAGPEVDRERARAALAMAGATPFVEALEAGMDTPLTEGGRELSGGQRQRLCIARALYRDAPILIFDEATSSLDGPAERDIAATLEELMTGRTVLLVSHRLSSVARADRVLVLAGGRVVESGPPRALWDTGGPFHDLFRDATLQ